MHHINLTLISLCSTGSLLLVGGCADDTSTAKTQAEYDDAAQAIGSSVAADRGGEAASIADSTSLALGVLPLGFSLEASGQIGGSRIGIDYAYQLRCEDAQGTALSSCDATTDRAEVDLTWSGELELPTVSASVDRSGAWTLDGLQGQTATLDGDSTLSLDSELRPDGRPVRTYRFDYAAAYDAVLIDVADRVVIGGTVHYAIDAEQTVGGDTVASFAMDGELALGASGPAMLTLDGEHAYRVDLATGAVVRW